MTPEPFGGTPIRTGAAYESAREEVRRRLAAESDARRVRLADDLVLVLESAERVATALEESLRADRVTEPERVAEAAPAFAAVAPKVGGVVGILYVDIADPAALADRLAEVGGIGSAVSLRIDERAITALADPDEDGAGAVHLTFALDDEHVRAVRENRARVAVVVDHPACRATVWLTDEQVDALTAELSRRE